MRVRFPTTRKKLRELASLPTFAGFKILSKKRVIVFLRDPIAKMFRPYAVGSSIVNIYIVLSR